MTKELEKEGYSRELMRAIQEMRKKASLVKQDKIDLAVVSIYDLSKFKKEIMEKVGAKKILFSEEKPKLNYDHILVKRIKDNDFEIMFKKV